MSLKAVFDNLSDMGSASSIFNHELNRSSLILLSAPRRRRSWPDIDLSYLDVSKTQEDLIHRSLALTIWSSDQLIFLGERVPFCPVLDSVPVYTS